MLYAASHQFPMEFQDLATYIWLQEALLVLFMAWSFDNEIFESITSGSVAYELCRPCDIYSMWFVKNVAMRLARVSLRCVPILLLAAFLPAPYGLTLPDSPAAAVLFLLSLIAGFALAIAFVMLIYISAFYTISSTGIRILSASVVEFFSGALIPIPFYPDGPPWPGASRCPAPTHQFLRPLLHRPLYRFRAIYRAERNTGRPNQLSEHRHSHYHLMARQRPRLPCVRGAVKNL